MNRSMPGLPVHHQLPAFTQTHVHRVGDTVQPSHPPLAPSPSQHQKSFPTSLMRWPKFWSFSFNISPSNEYSGLISFRINWLALLVIQGTLKSLIHHHSSKASILLHSAFFMVQLSLPYMTTGKTIALTKMDLCQQSDVPSFVSTVVSILACHSGDWGLILQRGGNMPFGLLW